MSHKGSQKLSECRSLKQPDKKAACVVLGDVWGVSWKCSLQGPKQSVLVHSCLVFKEQQILPSRPWCLSLPDNPEVPGNTTHRIEMRTYGTRHRVEMRTYGTTHKIEMGTVWIMDHSLFNTGHTIFSINFTFLYCHCLVYSVFWLHVFIFELTLSPRSPLGPTGPVTPMAPGLPCRLITSTTRLHVGGLGFGSWHIMRLHVGGLT